MKKQLAIMAGQYNVVQYSDEETMVIMAEQYNVVQYWWRNNGYHDWTIQCCSVLMKKQWLSWLNNTKRLNNTKMLSVSTDKGINDYQGWTIQCSTNNVVYLCFKNWPPLPSSITSRDLLQPLYTSSTPQKIYKPTHVHDLEAKKLLRRRGVLWFRSKR